MHAPDYSNMKIAQLTTKIQAAKATDQQIAKAIE